MSMTFKAKLHIDCINSTSKWAWGKAWQYWCITESSMDPMWTKSSRLSSLHTSQLRLEERKMTTNFGNELSLQRLSLPGFPLTLHGPFAVMPYAGEGTVNILPSIRRTWDCKDVPSRQTFSLWIWSSLVTREVLKSSLCSQTWPLKGCA